MGSTTHIVDEDGIVLNHYDYDAWGNLTAQEEAVPNRFKFTGQQLDPVTQQYYLRARFYNPVIARFTQEDTYRGDGLNLYAYCQNNPVFYVDPSGNYSDCVKDAYNRIRREDPTLSASVAYQRALQERGFDKLSKEDNRRRSEAANLNRQLKDSNLNPTERDQIFNKSDEINNKFLGLNQHPKNSPETPHADLPNAETIGNVKKGDKSTVGQWDSRGYHPKPGERTLKGYVNQHAAPEIKLITNSSGFNNHDGVTGGEFKRFGADPHGGISPHVHQPRRNVKPNGEIYGSVGTKTRNGGVTSPTPKDVKQLYEYLVNGKYH